MVLVVMAVASIVTWKTVHGRGLGVGRFKVLKMTAEPFAPAVPSEAPRAGDHGMVARQSLGDVARLAAGLAAAVPVRRVDGNAFIVRAEQTAQLSPAQHARLAATFQLAAKLQATVDATDNPETRADLQRRLDGQVRTRLRMILPQKALPLLIQVDEAAGPVTFEFHQEP
jgi:hypothetical protein